MEQNNKELIKEQRMATLTNRMAIHFITILKNFLIIPLLLMLTSWIGFESISYLHALIITILTNVIYKLFKLNDNNK